MPSGVLLSAAQSGSHSRVDSSSDSFSSEEIRSLQDPHPDVFDSRRLERQESVIQIRRPHQPNVQSLLQIGSEIKPKTQIHFGLLAKCAGLQGTAKLGHVNVSLTKEFLLWASKLEPELVEQIYIDAVYLSGKACPALSDCVGLNQEAQINRPWGEDDLVSLKAIRINARSRLKEYTSLRSNKTKISSRDMKDLNDDYFAATAGAKLADDYQYAQRASRFRQELSTLQSNSDSPKKLSQALSSMQHTVPTGKTELVLALKRLRMRFEQDGSPATR